MLMLLVVLLVMIEGGSSSVLGTVQVQIVEELALVVGVQPLALLCLRTEAAVLEALPRVQVADAGVAYMQRQTILRGDLEKRESKQRD